MLSKVVIDEVVRQFHFCSEAQVNVFPSMNNIEIEPELWFTHEDEFSIYITVIPQVGISAKGAKSFGEGGTPNACELETVEGMFVSLSSKVVFVKCLDAERSGKVCRMPAGRGR